MLSSKLILVLAVVYAIAVHAGMLLLIWWAIYQLGFSSTAYVCAAAAYILFTTVWSWSLVYVEKTLSKERLTHEKQ